MYKVWQSLMVGVLVMVLLLMAPLANAQSPSSYAGVDNSSMGVYRALAQIAFELYQKHDYANAAKVARVIEVVWDRNGSMFAKESQAMHDEIDRAMDAFIKPVIANADRPVDAGLIESSCRDYLDKLKKFDKAED
jgi:hypothetical protein